MSATRLWYVHALPVPGYVPGISTIDPGTGYENKSIIGPFDSALSAARYAEEQRPVSHWTHVSIISNRRGGNTVPRETSEAKGD